MSVSVDEDEDEDEAEASELEEDASAPVDVTKPVVGPLLAAGDSVSPVGGSESHPGESTARITTGNALYFEASMGG